MKRLTSTVFASTMASGTSSTPFSGSSWRMAEGGIGVNALAATYRHCEKCGKAYARRVIDDIGLCLECTLKK